MSSRTLPEKLEFEAFQDALSKFQLKLRELPPFGSFSKVPLKDSWEMFANSPPREPHG